MRFGLLAMLAVAAACVGCSKPQPFETPFCVASSVYYNDALNVDVFANTPDEAEVPRITNVDVIVDGRATKTPAQVRQDKADKWLYRHAEFVAPAGAREIKAIVTIDYMGKQYEMTVPFYRVPTWEKFRWYREEETLSKPLSATSPAM